MNVLNKRSLLKAVALSAVALATLAACGKKEEAPAAAPGPAAAPAADKLKIGFMYVSPIGDGGWTYQHELGRKAIQEKFGDRIETSFVESVPESADAERVMRDMAGQGNQLIFATSFGYPEFVQKAAADLPDVKFEHATGYKQAANVATYDTKTFEGAYGRHRRRRHEQDQDRGGGGLGADPRSGAQHQQLRAGRAKRGPVDQGQGGVGQ